MEKKRVGKLKSFFEPELASDRFAKFSKATYGWKGKCRKDCRKIPHSILLEGEEIIFQKSKKTILA